MGKIHSYVYTSLQLIEGYTGELPLSIYIKNFFRQHKKFGSRDRKWIKNMCFAWFRAGGLFNQFNTMNRLLCSFYLMQQEGDARANDVMNSGGDVYNGIDFKLPRDQKIAWIHSNIGPVEIESRFPFHVDFTAALNVSDYLHGLWSQPKVWLRAKSGKMELVKNVLIQEGVAFHTHEEMPNAIQLDQGVSLDKLNLIEKGLAEVQDLSSQRTIELIPAKPGEHWYDACAASGGKSLMLMDTVPGVKLSVSDSRESILTNLKQRFLRNGILNYNFFVADLTDDKWKPASLIPMDGIIADVPCSGSGTWARTPEQMIFFSENKLKHYISLQEKITKKLCSLLRPGGKLVYITCSVFKAENEDRVIELENFQDMKCLQLKLYQGTKEGADTLFVALLEKK